MIRRVSADGLLWLCGISIVTAACSGGADTSSTPAQDDEPPAATAAQSVTTDKACELLTKAEAQTALGSPIEDVNDESAPTPIGTMLRSSCYYESEDGGSVTLTLSRYDDAQNAATKFDALKRMYGAAREVPNLGDAAFAERETLVIKQGNVHLLIKLDPEGANKIVNYSDTKAMDALLAVERQIASRALGRLPASGSTATAGVSAPGSSSKSVCSMLTKAEMEAILGGPLSHAVPNDSPAQTVCTYTGAGGRYAQVTVEWQGGASGMAGTNLAGALMGAAGGQVKTTTPVAGLGDEAVMLIGGVLNVRKGPALVTVDLRMQQDYEAKGKAIAERVLARI